MMNGIEASVAAGEILALIEKLKEKYKDKPDAIEALVCVEKKAQEIKKLGDSGWY